MRSVRPIGLHYCTPRNTSVGLKQVCLKAGTRRGRKRANWVKALHEKVREEFHRFRSVGVKLNMNTLRLLALSILYNSSKALNGKGLIDSRSGKPQRNRIEARWIQTFCDRFLIVCRNQSGKLKLRAEKTIELEKEVALHLGILKRSFENR